MDSFLKRQTRKAAAWTVIIFLLMSMPSSYAEEKELSLQDLAKTPAAQFFVKKQYPEALAAFQELEVLHPQNILIKRYIASLYDSMNQRAKAIQKLREGIALKPEDWISRQMLGDFYIKEGQLTEAETEFRAILEGSGAESPNGKYAEKKLASLEKIQRTAQSVEGKQMAAQEFMRSEPAQAFAKGKYKKAIEGFEALILKYPQDPLIYRFRGIALLKTNQGQDAIASFQNGLRIAPDNSALHFYLGQAYAQIGTLEAARKEFQWVIQHDQGPYQLRAKQALFQSLRGITPKPSKKWTLTMNNGYEYDSNATFKSRDMEFSQAGDQNSSRFNTSLIGTYRFYQKKSWFFTSDAIYAQSLYSDFPNLQTYTAGAGLSALRIFNLLGKSAYFNVRNGVLHTFLKNKFFVFSNTFSPSVIVNISEQYRANVGYRFTVNQYESRGTSPDTTDRNGLANGFSLGATRYFDDAKKNSITLGYDFDYDHARGANYRKKKTNTGRAELRWLLPGQVEFALAFRYKDSRYPKYASGPPGRWDHQFTVTPSLTRAIYKDYLFLTVSYTYEITPARNNAFEYYKHILGVQVSTRL
jgi:tetratricopeptide (TPR) repeat protein